MHKRKSFLYLSLMCQCRLENKVQCAIWNEAYECSKEIGNSSMHTKFLNAYAWENACTN